MTVKLDKTGFNKLLAVAYGLDKLEVRVGVFSSRGGNATTDDGFTMLELFATQEFGTKDGHVPERKPLRTTFEEKKAEAAQMVTDLCRKVVTDGMDARRALNLLGLWGATAVKKRITQGAHLPPPNAPSTVERKGSDRPLVDTGRMVAAITHVVTEEGTDLGADPPGTSRDSLGRLRDSAGRFI